MVVVLMCLPLLTLNRSVGYERGRQTSVVRQETAHAAILPEVSY